MYLNALLLYPRYKLTALNRIDHGAIRLRSGGFHVTGEVGFVRYGSRKGLRCLDPNKPLPRGQTRHWVVAGKEVRTMLTYGLGIDRLQPVFPLLLLRA